MKYLRPLPKNGTIGIMAPASPVDEEKLQKAVIYFEKLGYRTLVMSSCYAREYYFAGSTEMRVTDLMQLVNNPVVDAIFFARGGFGSMAMLPHLDFKKISSSRKLMVGYSDITALQWGIYAKTGMPSLSAGMPATDFHSEILSPVFETEFWKFIETGKINYSLEVPSNRKHPAVRGISFPGTLSVAAKLAGSSFFPDLEKAVLILEDVAEPRHKMEGYFLQAKLSGWFDQCRAVVLGDFSPSENEIFPKIPPLENIFERIFGDLDLPLVTGVPYGHLEHKIPFPLGVELSLSFGLSVEISSIDSIFNS